MESLDPTALQRTQSSQGFEYFVFAYKQISATFSLHQNDFDLCAAGRHLGRKNFETVEPSELIEQTICINKQRHEARHVVDLFSRRTL